MVGEIIAKDRAAQHACDVMLHPALTDIDSVNNL